MSNRNYSVFFNTHTVSGIVISFVLYVIFFAGAFALFREEINIWEKGKEVSYVESTDIDFDAILTDLDKKYDLTARDIRISFNEKENKVSVLLNASKDSLASDDAKQRRFFYVDIDSFKTKTYQENYNIGEFLYRLHFFNQIPVIGIYLAGFVAFFFLFAIVTGLIVHWKKIIPNFYAFNPKIALKRVWTDAHTALGFLGLPFQFMFAITGTYLCLSVLVLLPAKLLYGGDESKVMGDFFPAHRTYEWVAASEDSIPSFNKVAQQTAIWDNFEITRAIISNYGGVNMKYFILGEVQDSNRFIGIGRILFDATTGIISTEKDANVTTYKEDVQRVITRLHYAEFGGISTKIIYFILAFITCFVIITGVLIYIEARNKKSYTLKQRLYTNKVGHIYMAICLSMLPVTALAFLFVKIFNGYFIDKKAAIYWFYFITWLVFILFFRFKRDNYYTNKITLLLGAVFGFLIPIVNGIVSGQWIWKTFAENQFEILLIDILWVVIASISLLFYLKIKPKVKENSAFAKHPIDYKNITTLKAEEAKKLQSTQNSTTIISVKTDKSYINNRIKIIILWLFLGIGWIVHHIYGLFNIYYKETLIIEGATGEAPLAHHIFRILFEGLCLFFALLTLEVSKKWFQWTSIIWAIIAGLFNVYHFIEAIIFESSNISEIFMLGLVSLASIFLVKALFQWKKE